MTAAFFETFQAVKAELAAVVPGSIEHIGATSVPLPGRPVVDVQVGVPDRAAAVAALARLGFAGGCPLTRRAGPPVDVYVLAREDPRLVDNIALRQYLRTHPDAAHAYAAGERDAAWAAARRWICACRHDHLRVPATREEALERAGDRVLGVLLEPVEVSRAKYMAVLRCRRCGAHWGADSISSGHMELLFAFPIETGDPHAWLADEAATLDL
jgi:GrpB-like predicted nucleotidyltransferase (UPF0157 family)